MSFITDDFLLTSKTARKLYDEHAAGQPIYDYHCHLPPRDLANNRRFGNLFELWLEGDHYKWRAMRAAGVAERYCTGDAEPFEKFMAWAKTVPLTLRNPLYHWTHLELKRYFDIDTILNEDTAQEIWDEANRQIAEMDCKAILKKFKVVLIGTTDDPADTLEHHAKLNADSPYANTVIYPAFRPDNCYKTADVKAFNAYVDRVANAAGANCDDLAGFMAALKQRHDFFYNMGSRLSDHGLTHLPNVTCTDEQAATIFTKARGGQSLTQGEQDQFAVYMMLYFGKLDHFRGWVKQLHLGPMRNNNGWAFKNLGPDTGFDSIGDYPQGEGLSRYLGTLADREQLPRTVIYNINPRDNYLFATMAGNFPGMQYGSGWWFCDQLEGMTRQLNALSNLGLLSKFVGMLTDSRSFLSYPRHEYFRRLLCELIGRDVEAGQLPRDMKLLGTMVENICFHNAKHYFGMALKGKYA